MQFLKHDPISLGTEFDSRHEFTHQHQTASVRRFKIFIFCTIGDVFRAKTRALILDLNSNASICPLKIDPNRLVGTQFISVLDGIRHRFIDGKTNPEFLSRRKPRLPDLGHDSLNDRLPGFIIAGNLNLELIVEWLHVLKTLESVFLRCLNIEDFVQPGDLKYFVDFWLNTAKTQF